MRNNRFDCRKNNIDVTRSIKSETFVDKSADYLLVRIKFFHDICITHAFNKPDKPLFIINKSQKRFTLLFGLDLETSSANNSLAFLR